MAANRKREKERRDSDPYRLEAHRAACRAWPKQNPEAYRAKSSRGRARRRGAIGGSDKVNATTMRRLLQVYGETCVYCQAAPWQEWDHVHPIALGGQHSAENLVPACQPCNRRKGAQPLDQFLATLPCAPGGPATTS